VTNQQQVPMKPPRPSRRASTSPLPSRTRAIASPAPISPLSRS